MVCGIETISYHSVYYIPHIFHPFQYVEQGERANSEAQALLDDQRQSSE